MRTHPILVVVILLAGLGLVASAADVPPGFEPIFDGKTLDGWDGDPTYWRVEGGSLIGEVTPATLLKENSWIVWRGGQVEDFELLLEYRISSKGNSGVGYRLGVLEGKPFAVRGPQADIHGEPMFTGITYEENGRRLLASRGQSSWIDPGGVPRVIVQIAHPGELQAVVRNEEWNRYHLIVKGHDAKHFLNGVQMSEYHDYDDANRMHRGLIGVQVHVGPPMKVEFRNILVKPLSTSLGGAVPRGTQTYKPGSLVEFEHQPTFANIEKQTARLTAPLATAPLDGKQELTLVTRNLGVVRHDLTNVPVLAPAQPRTDKESGFDLVAMSDDQVVRIPNAGHLIIGKLPLDKTYRLQLKWNAGETRYDVVSLSPAN